MDNDAVVKALVGALLGCRGYIVEVNPSDKQIIEEIDAVLEAVALLQAHAESKKGSYH